MIHCGPQLPRFQSVACWLNCIVTGMRQNMWDQDMAEASCLPPPYVSQGKEEEREQVNKKWVVNPGTNLCQWAAFCLSSMQAQLTGWYCPSSRSIHTFPVGSHKPVSRGKPPETCSEVCFTNLRISQTNQVDHSDETCPASIAQLDNALNSDFQASSATWVLWKNQMP